MSQFPPAEILFKNLGFSDDQKVHKELKILFGFLVKNDDDDDYIEKWRNIYEKFCEILQETKSVIYGEFILNAVSGITEKCGRQYNPFTLDIFATYLGAVAINDFIKTHMSHIFYASDQQIKIIKPHKHSIDRNNKVLSQITYIMRITSCNLYINIVDDDPSHVVSKQDLSFLQILFDGEHVKAINIQDVKTRIGNLNQEYLPLVDWDEKAKNKEEDEDDGYEKCAVLSISRYTDTNFTINYNESSELIGYGYLYGKEVGKEEHLVLYLYNNLVNNLVNNVFRKMIDIIYIENEDITCADVYLRWFYLEKPTIKEFMKIIRKIVRNSEFLLPLWIKATYKQDNDRERALLIDSCSLDDYFAHYRYDHKKDRTKATEFAMGVIDELDFLLLTIGGITNINESIIQNYLKKPKIYALIRIIKKIMLKKYLVLPESDQYKYDYTKDYDILIMLLTHIKLFDNYFIENKYFENESKTFKKFALKFIQRFGFESEEELQNVNSEQHSIKRDYKYKISKAEITAETFKNYLEIAKYERYMTEKEDKEKSKPNTRNIPALNIVRPSRIHQVDYDEKNRMVGQKCMNASNFSLYDINAYLKGERVRAYTKDGEKSPLTNLLPVNSKDAMKRLIFFLATSEKLDKLTPFCYNLDLLTKDIGSLLYVECKDIDNQEGLNYLFGQNPIISLNFGFSIYVPLSEILDAIYNTKNQVFVLVPTDKVFKYTASMAIQFGTVQSGLGGHHCQEGSNKPLHTIKVCKGTEGNVCWPVNEAIELNEVYPDSYFMKQKFYIWSKSVSSMDAQSTIANQSYIDKVRRRREKEIKRQRNMSRTPDEILKYLTLMFSRDVEFPLIIDIVVDIVVKKRVSSYSTADRIFLKVQKNHRRLVELGDIPESPDILRQLLTFETDSDEEEFFDSPDTLRQLSDDEESIDPPDTLRQLSDDEESIDPPDTLRQLSDDEESIDPPDVRRQLLDLFGTDSDEESPAPPTEEPFLFRRRTPDEIREYLTNMFSDTDQFELLIDRAVNIVDTETGRSYDEALRVFDEVGRNIPRPPDAIRAYLTRRFPRGMLTIEEFRHLVDVAVDVVDELPVSSYNEADRVFADIRNDSGNVELERELPNFEYDSA